MSERGTEGLKHGEARRCQLAHVLCMYTRSVDRPFLGVSALVA